MNEKIIITEARREDASEVATLIMEAMDHDCCQNFAGPHHTLGDFHGMMTRLVQMDDSQYSYRNTLVAMCDGSIAGCLVSYDGKDMLRLRRRFIEAAKEHLGRDFSDMPEETAPGEYYLDSLCVHEQYRHRGIASLLLRTAIERHGVSQPVGLLVDHSHPWAERLYRSIGFRVVNETSWGGHPMRHMQAWAASHGVGE